MMGLITQFGSYKKTRWYIPRVRQTSLDEGKKSLKKRGKDTFPFVLSLLYAVKVDV